MRCAAYGVDGIHHDEVVLRHPCFRNVLEVDVPRVRLAVGVAAVGDDLRAAHDQLPGIARLVAADLAARTPLEMGLVEFLTVKYGRVYVGSLDGRVYSFVARTGKLAKAYATEMAVRVTSEAIQIHGANGLSPDYPIERHFRDARVLGIGGGTNEIMNEIISKLLGL